MQKLDDCLVWSKLVFKWLWNSPRSTKTLKVRNECDVYFYFCTFELLCYEFIQTSFIISFLTDIETTTLALDVRVTVLEENGGDDGNSSIAELEVRVETLEGTSDVHETRLTAAENDIEGIAH